MKNTVKLKPSRHLPAFIFWAETGQNYVSNTLFVNSTKNSMRRQLKLVLGSNYNSYCTYKAQKANTEKLYVVINNFFLKDKMSKNINFTCGW